jgi:hypothetical protein
MENHSSLMIFKIILGLFILSNALQLIVDILVGSTFGLLEPQKVKVEK